MGNIPLGSELLLDLFQVFKSGRSDQILFLEFNKDVPAGRIYICWFGQPGNDTVMICMFLLLPGVSILLAVSI